MKSLILLLVSSLAFAAPERVLEGQKLKNGDVVFTLPAADGTADQCLKTDGVGVWSFADCGGGGGGFDPSNITQNLGFNTGGTAIIKTIDEDTPKSLTVTTGYSNSQASPSGTLTLSTAQAGASSGSGGINVISGPGADLASGAVVVKSGPNSRTTGGVSLGSGDSSGTSQAHTGDVSVFSGSKGDENGHTGKVSIYSGSAASMSGTQSGDVELRTGTAGSRGKIIMKDGTEGTAGHVWTSTGTDGEGAWAAPSGGSGSPGGSDNYVQINKSGSFVGTQMLQVSENDSDGILNGGAPGVKVFNIGTNGGANFTHTRLQLENNDSSVAWQWVAGSTQFGGGNADGWLSLILANTGHAFDVDKSLRLLISEDSSAYNNTTPNSKIDFLGAMTWRGIGEPAVSPSGTGVMYYDTTTNKFRISQNGGAYVDLYSGGAIANNSYLQWRNQANDTDLNIMRVNTSDETEIYGDKIIMGGNVQLNSNVLVAGNAPSPAPNPGGGTGATCTVATGSTNVAGVINFTAGTTPGGSLVCTMTYDGPQYPNGSFCTVTPYNEAAAGTTVFAQGTTSDLQIFMPVPVDGTLYQFNYSCMGR